VFRYEKKLLQNNEYTNLKYLMLTYNERRYIFVYLSIYLTKAASYNIAGDGPNTQWDQFLKSGIILSTDCDNIYFVMYNSGGGDCF